MENFLDLKFYDSCDIDGGLRKAGKLKKSINDQPLISVITVVYNNENYLQECFDSVQSQNFKNFEHIVIDGGSTDKTIDIIKKK